MNDDVRQFASIFLESSRETLVAIERDLVRAEGDCSNRDLIEEIMRGLHTLKGSCAMFGLSAASKAAHGLEDLIGATKAKGIGIGGQMGLLLEGSDILRNIIEDFAANVDSEDYQPDSAQCEAFLVKVESARASVMSTQTNLAPLIAEITEEFDRLRIHFDEIPGIDPFLAAMDRLKEATAPQEQDAAAIQPQEMEQTAEAAPASEEQVAASLAPAAAASSTIRVEESKVEAFLGSVGELIIVAEMYKYIQQQFERRGSTDAVLREFKITTNAFNDHIFALQKALMDMRRVSLKSICDRLPRLVRDAAQSIGKEVDLSVSGAEAVVDKSLMERVEACLVQLLRNAVAHGIEPADQRISAGKPPKGKIVVDCHNDAEHLIFAVTDNGGGLDLNKIKRKALNLNIATASEVESMSDRQVAMLIFRSGLSTREEVDMVSGRGVGLDVVAAETHKLGGAIEIDTRPGQGTTISVRFPLHVTLSVISGIVAAVGDTHLIIPSESVVESVTPKKEQVTTIEGKGEVFQLRGRLLPLMRIGKMFGLSQAIKAVGGDPDAQAKGKKSEVENVGVVVIIREGEHEAAFHFDRILDLQQVVVKNVDGINLPQEFLGAALLGDGRIGFVLDCERLLGTD